MANVTMAKTEETVVKEAKIEEILIKIKIAITNQIIRNGTLQDMQTYQMTRLAIASTIIPTAEKLSSVVILSPAPGRISRPIHDQNLWNNDKLGSLTLTTRIYLIHYTEA